MRFVFFLYTVLASASCATPAYAYCFRLYWKPCCVVFPVEAGPGQDLSHHTPFDRRVAITTSHFFPSRSASRKHLIHLEQSNYFHPLRFFFFAEARFFLLRQKMTTPANLLKFVRKKDDTVKKRFERCCEKKPASLKNENSVSTVLTRDTVPSREGGGTWSTRGMGT